MLIFIMESMEIDTSNEHEEYKEDALEIFKEDENNDIDEDFDSENYINMSQNNKKRKL